MRTSVHPLRLPRLVTGMVQRCREEERVGIWDEVPVEIREFTAAEAPIAWRRNPSDPGIRITDGVPYGVLGPRLSPDQAWEGIVADVEPILLCQLDMGPYRQGSMYEPLLPWQDMLAGASRRRGLSRAGEILFRDVVDDGRAAQAAAARRLGERLAIVDGRLCLRGGLPRLTVFPMDKDVSIRAGLVQLEWEQDPEIGEPWRFNHFRLDRPDEAVAYGEALARTLGGKLDFPARQRDVEIVDPDALSACYDRIADEDALALSGIAGTVASAVRKGLGMLPEPEIARYLELRALERGRDATGLRAWFDGLPGTRDALAKAFPNFPNGQPGLMREELVALDRAALRLSVVDDLRHGLVEDGEALSGLAPAA